MNIDIEAFGGLHLEGCLDACVRERSLRGIRSDCLFHVAADLGKLALGVVVFLGVVVPGNPPGCVVTGHCKLGVLLLYDEIGQPSLEGELVA